MDALLYELYKVSVQLLPVLGVIVLIFVVLVLRKALQFFSELSNTMNKVNATIDIVDRELNDMQAPINTIVSLSHTVDQVHEASIKSVKSLIAFVITNIDVVKNWVMEVVQSRKKDKEEDTVPEEVNEDGRE